MARQQAHDTPAEPYLAVWSDDNYCTELSDWPADSDSVLRPAQAMLLPDRWPDIPQLLQTHSLDFTLAVHPCVKKAASHLELLQGALNAFSGSSNLLAIAEATSCEETKVKSLTPGTGADSPGPAAAIPFLGVKDVIEEVITLLARLEKDRRETMEKLKEERERVEWLTREIDVLATNRLIDIAIAVQKEHEACLADIDELSWHVVKQTKSESHYQHIVDNMERDLKELRDEIDHIQVYTPLVREKLELEKLEMAKISVEQLDADKEWSAALEHYNTVSLASKNAMERATQERAVIKNEVDEVANELAKVSNSFTHAKRTMTDYVETCLTNQEMIKRHLHDLALQTQKYEQLQEQQVKQNEKLSVLHGLLTVTEAENVSLQSSKQLTMKTSEKQTSAHAAELKRLEASKVERERTLRALKRKNQELQIGNNDTLRKIENCDSKKLDNEAELVTVAKELEKTIDMNSVLARQFENATKLKEKSGDDQRLIVETTMREEHTLRVSNESVKATIKEEKQRLSALKAKIEAHVTDFKQFQMKAVAKKDVISKKLDEVEKAVTLVRERVEKLREMQKERTETIASLETEIAEAERKTEVEEVKHKELMKELVPQHSKLQADLRIYEQKLDEMETKTEEWANNIAHMESVEAVLERSNSTVFAEINTLQVELDELNVRVETGKQHKENVLQSYREAKARRENSTKEHTELMSNRGALLSQLKVHLDERTSINKMSASSYRRLQQDCFDNRVLLQREFVARVDVENRIKELEEIKSVQQRVHSALQQYYKQRNLLYNFELNRLRTDSENNAAQVVTSQREMDDSLRNVNIFMETELGLSLRSLDSVIPLTS